MPYIIIKRLHFIFPLAVSLIILYCLFLKIDIRKTFLSLQGCDIKLVGLAVLLSLSINLFLGAEKWRRILAAMGCRLPYREVLSIRTGCIPFKILLPLKSSELLKAIYLDRRGKLSFSRSTSSLLLDKVLNLLVVIPIAIIGLTFVDIHMPMIVLLFILLLILLIVYSNSFRQGLIVIATGIHPRLKGVAGDLLSGFREVNTAEKTILIVYSFVYALLEIINAFILLKAVGVTVPFLYLMIIIPVIMVINNLPITALGLGTREIAVVYFFADFGSAASLLSGGLLISLIEHVLPVAAGLLFIRSFHAYFIMKDDTRLVKMAEK